MYVELKSLEALRAAELSQVAAPGYAISWLKNAQSGFCQVRGFNDAWEACVHEVDPRRGHWNHRAHGFDLLCQRIRNGEMVVILAPSWPPTSPAYAKVNGQWEPTQHMREPRARQRLETRVKTLQYEQREAEILQSQNRPSSAVVQTELASVPGTRAGTLGPHVGDGNPGRKADSAISLETVAARKKLAHDFYKEQGMPEHKIEAHLEGIDFSKPVERIKLEKGSIVEQHQIPNATQGNYYNRPGADSRQLGISKDALDGKTGKIVAREPRKYLLNKDTEVLSSSVRAVEDTWSIPGKSVKADGGGIQYFTMQRGNFTSA